MSLLLPLAGGQSILQSFSFMREVEPVIAEYKKVMVALGTRLVKTIRQQQYKRNSRRPERN